MPSHVPPVHQAAPPHPAPPQTPDLEARRRALRVRLLRDLVENGLYKVPVEALADRLMSVLRTSP